MKIKLTKLAAQDLQSTKNYISQDKPNAALAVIRRVIEAIENIVTFPSMGRAGRVPHTTELVVSGSPLIIVYQIKQDTLYIVRIIHTARKWP
jgi:addiction module RelE/StbE family toxin